MKTVEIANLQDYQNLKLVDKLNSKLIEKANFEQHNTLFALVTSAQNLHKIVKKSDLPDDKKTEVMKLIAKIVNTTNGILDSPEITREIAKENISKLKKRASKVVSAITEHISSVYKESVSSISYEDVEALTANLQSDNKKEIEKIIDSNRTLIHNLQHHSENLPLNKSDVKSSFIMSKLPVVAISHLTSDDFKSAGFSVEKIGSYSILKDQLVVGLNPDKIEGTLPAYLKLVVNALSNSTNEKYLVMPNSTGYRNSGIIFYWLVPEKDADRLLHNTGKNFSINKWGFAFK